MVDLAPSRRDAFGALPIRDGLSIRTRSDVGIVSIHARGPGALSIGGLTPPDEPRFVGGDELGVLGVGPGAWLAIKSRADPFWAAALRDELAASASVTDQSGAYAVLRLEGERAPALLAKAAFVDFSPDVFASGAVAVTVAAHIPLIVWRPGAALSYDLAVFRSYAGSFAHWLDFAIRMGGL